MIALYSTLLAAVFVLGAPYWLVRLASTARYRQGLGQRLGRVPPSLRALVARRHVIWLHAVSVGEVLAAGRLITELETALGPAWIVVLSTTTATGHALARQRLGQVPNSPDRVFFYPLDFTWAVRTYLEALQPRLLILMESELWPRMLAECRRAHIPVAVVNARVSDRSFRRSLRARPIWSRILQLPTLFLTQSDEDARRLIALGAPAEAVHTTGNLKYDIRAPTHSHLADLIRHAANGRPILVAGSTVAGAPVPEEQLLLEGCMVPLWQAIPDLLLVLAPRHKERFDAVADLVTSFGPVLRATGLAAQTSPTALDARILLLDTLGDLAAVYALADVAFVGGSLVPRGGHNPLEPAQFGVPVVMGPSFDNFRDIVTKMQAADGILIAPDPNELATTLLKLLLNPEVAEGLGKRGQQVFEQQQGATARTVEALLPLTLRTREAAQP